LPSLQNGSFYFGIKLSIGSSWTFFWGTQHGPFLKALILNWIFLKISLLTPCFWKHILKFFFQGNKNLKNTFRNIYSRAKMKDWEMGRKIFKIFFRPLNMLWKFGEVLKHIEGPIFFFSSEPLHFNKHRRLDPKKWTSVGEKKKYIQYKRPTYI
jgi:hypothetical protein